MRVRRKHRWQRCGSSVGACGAVKERCSRTPLAAVVAEGAADSADSALSARSQIHPGAYFYYYNYY